MRQIYPTYGLRANQALPFICFRFQGKRGRLFIDSTLAWPKVQSMNIVQGDDTSRPLLLEVFGGHQILKFVIIAGRLWTKTIASAETNSQ